MSHEPALIRAYLENVLLALTNEQADGAECLAQHAFELLHWAMPFPSSHSSLPVSLSYGVGLDTGIKRAGKPNEDYAFATKFVYRRASSPLPVIGGLFLIADGMGGHAKGADAAHLAVHTAVDCILPQLMGSQLQGDEIPALLTQGVQVANHAVYLQNTEAMGREATAKMGTTISVAVALGSSLYVANVGDSRTYILRRGGQLQQITRDHSVVADLLVNGEIEAAELYTHPQRNLIYRCLGEQALVEVDTFSEHIEDGDSILLCSDGLWEMLPEVGLIEDVLCSPWMSVEKMVERLVQLARSGGGLDNISVIVAQVRLPDVQDMPTMLIPPPAPVPAHALESGGMHQAVSA